jgi:hypothetical protein
MQRDWCTRKMGALWGFSIDRWRCLLWEVHDSLLYLLILSDRIHERDSSWRWRPVVLTHAPKLSFWWTTSTNAWLTTVSVLECRELWATEGRGELTLLEGCDGDARRWVDACRGKSNACLTTVALV